ncbi:SRR1-like protein isoform X2 [Lasioglossum baleicum]|uniref:SRR1-like protein isoform X2 n=1 Tax=Lasioglossum baleicum TaxID=434251 RepID=UPI003FCC3F8E
MACETRDTGEFKLVSRRKKRVSRVRNSSDPNVPLPEDDNDDNFSDVNCEVLFGLLEAETELRSTLFADNVFHSMKSSLNALNVDGVSEILCYGLGPFLRLKSSKYQLALLLSLKNHYGSRVYVYDPIFSSKEIEFLLRFGFNVLNVNEEGKRIVENNVTLVYMPHCATHLTNNFLYANWGERLCKCILLTNSFSAVVDNLTAANRSGCIDYIVRIQPYVTEIALRNNFPHEEAFNDLNLHIFLEQDINKIPRNFWNEREEPCYRNTTIDYFTAKQTEQIDARISNYVSRPTG